MADPKSRSVALAADKARELRVLRLTAILEDGRLDNPLAVLDSLLAELADGASQTQLWEKLHGNAMREGKEKEVGDAYQRTVAGIRMKRLGPREQSEVLMHQVDYVSGILGDAETASVLLERVLDVAPDNEDAFGRLEKRLEKLMAVRRLVELYARVAATPPRPAQVLATQVLHRLAPLPPSDPVSAEACKKLVALVPVNPKLLDAIDAHCRATKRAALAAEVLEKALVVDADAGDAVTRPRRHRLVELYFGEVAKPAAAIDHVEKLLERDPNDTVAFKAGERLMSNRDVSSRAAAALQAARRARTP
jgi:tetratricopeptide (TPR) repeat protein